MAVASGKAETEKPPSSPEQEAGFLDPLAESSGTSTFESLIQVRSASSIHSETFIMSGWRAQPQQPTKRSEEIEPKPVAPNIESSTTRGKTEAVLATPSRRRGRRRRRSAVFGSNSRSSSTSSEREVKKQRAFQEPSVIKRKSQKRQS
ncbi:hypothetical protein ISCGN_021663 [Ixodes scapularis]